MQIETAEIAQKVSILMFIIDLWVNRWVLTTNALSAQREDIWTYDIAITCIIEGRTIVMDITLVMVAIGI